MIDVISNPKRLFDNVRCKQELLRRQRFPPSSWSMCHSSCISPSMRNTYESYCMTRQNWLIACVRFFLLTDKIMKSFREVWFSNNHLKPACKNCFGYKINNHKQTPKKRQWQSRNFNSKCFRRSVFSPLLLLKLPLTQHY